jgi:coenzyme F420 hydrogenase subunit beta
MESNTATKLLREVVDAGICTGCGACIAVHPDPAREMSDTPWGPRPELRPEDDLSPLAWDACPGKGIHYPTLYADHYGALPDHWLLGRFKAVRTGYSGDPSIRAAGASGGVLTHVLVRLLEEKRIDAAIAVRQGVPTPRQARAVVAETRDAILATAQSVYVPVSVLDVLRRLDPKKRYAMTCLPDQSAALRVLQKAGHPQACAVRYVLGPYTGTALYPAAIGCYLKSKGVRADDEVVSLKWRAGDWPGYLEIRTASGTVLRSNKFYYNFLIPFFVTQASLQSMDFANEFTDLSVGDAWSPRFEALGGGHSVIVTRSDEMELLIQGMEKAGRLVTTPEEPLRASEMHGHMLDFKKRGGYIRNRMRRWTGRKAPDYGLRPAPLPFSRVVVEGVISFIFFLCGTAFARRVVARIPESVIGPLFDGLRKSWKAASKPTKRKGLGGLNMQVISEK